MKNATTENTSSHKCNCCGSDMNLETQYAVNLGTDSIEIHAWHCPTCGNYDGNN